MKEPELTYSEAVYLFADKFISKRSKFVNYEKHPNGEKFPVSDLGNLMVLAAIVFLKKKNYIKTEIRDVKKLLVFNGKDIFAQRLKDKEKEVTGIEEILMDNFKREEKVQKAVYHLLTTDVTLPWWPIINISKQSLVKKGYLIAVEEKKFIGHVTNYEFEPEKVREVELHLNEIQNVLNEFSSDTQYSMVLNAVKKGISARVEHQSNDD